MLDQDIIEKVLKLDKFKCRLCHSEDYLKIHHLDGDENNKDLDNLALLCRRCYLKNHGYGHRLSEQTKEILERFEKGERPADLAKAYGLSRQRIFNIINYEPLD